MRRSSEMWWNQTLLHLINVFGIISLKHFLRRAEKIWSATISMSFFCSREHIRTGILQITLIVMMMNQSSHHWGKCLDIKHQNHATSPCYHPKNPLAKGQIASEWSVTSRSLSRMCIDNFVLILLPQFLESMGLSLRRIWNNHWFWKWKMEPKRLVLLCRINLGHERCFLKPCQQLWKSDSWSCF